jgi:hypothetical protein
MQESEMGMTLGKFKFIFERWKNYLGIVGLILALRMNVLLSPIEWYWIVIGFVLSVVIVYLDMRFVLPEEGSIGTRKNPEMMEMKRMIEEIHKKL